MMTEQIPQPVENKSSHISSSGEKENTESTKALYDQVGPSKPRYNTHTLPPQQQQGNSSVMTTARQKRLDTMSRSRNNRVRSVRSRSPIQTTNYYISKTGKIISEREIKRQYVKQKIARFDHATNKGGFNFKSKFNKIRTPSNTSFRSVDKIRIPHVKTYGRKLGYSSRIKKMRFKGF